MLHPLSARWALAGNADVGGFGVGSELSYQLYAGAKEAVLENAHRQEYATEISMNLFRPMGIVHHTDAEREWTYDRKSHIGRLDKALDEAQSKGWTVVSMKDDWKRIFPLEIK